MKRKYSVLIISMILLSSCSIKRTAIEVPEDTFYLYKIDNPIDYDLSSFKIGETSFEAKYLYEDDKYLLKQPSYKYFDHHELELGHWGLYSVIEDADYQAIDVKWYDCDFTNSIGKTIRIQKEKIKGKTGVFYCNYVNVEEHRSYKFICYKKKKNYEVIIKSRIPVIIDGPRLVYDEDYYFCLYFRNEKV